MEWKTELYLAAREHCEDIGPLGLYGHSSSLGLTMFDRVSNYTEMIPGLLAECVSFGSLHPTESLILMLVDDGDPSERKLREHLLDPKHRYFGFAIGKHKFQHGIATAMMCMEWMDKRKLREIKREYGLSDSVEEEIKNYENEQY